MEGQLGWLRLQGKDDTASGWVRGFRDNGKVCEQLRASLRTGHLGGGLRCSISCNLPGAELCEFKVSLNYSESSRPIQAYIKRLVRY